MTSTIFALPPEFAAELGAQPLKHLLHEVSEGVVSDILTGLEAERIMAFGVGAVLVWFRENKIESIDEMFSAFEKAL